MSALALDQANRIVAAALAKSKEQGYKPMGVVLVDASGHVMVVQREDGASMFRLDSATGKAWAALDMGVATRVLTQRAMENPNFFITLATTAGGKFLPQAGAVLIKGTDGTVLGVIGASGSTGDEDDAIGIAGVESVGHKHG